MTLRDCIYILTRYPDDFGFSLGWNLFSAFINRGGGTTRVHVSNAGELRQLGGINAELRKVSFSLCLMKVCAREFESR